MDCDPSSVVKKKNHRRKLKPAALATFKAAKSTDDSLKTPTPLETTSFLPPPVVVSTAAETQAMKKLLREEAEKLLNLGLAQGESGNVAASELSLNASVRKFKKAGKFHPVHLRNAYNALGLLHFTKGHSIEAQTCLDVAMKSYELDSKRGFGHPAFLDSGGLLNDAAILFKKQGEFKQAEVHLKRALYLAQRLHTPHATLMVATHTNLGELYAELGNVDKGEAHLRHATTWLGQETSFMSTPVVETTTAARSENNDAVSASPLSSFLDPHAIAATVYSSLGRLCLLQGRLQESLHFLEHAVRRSALCTPPKPIHGTALSTLALFHLHQHNAVSAAKLLRLSRTALRATKSKDVEMAICVNNLATVVGFTEAHKLLTQAERICLRLKKNKNEKGHLKLDACLTAVRANQETLREIVASPSCCSFVSSSASASVISSISPVTPITTTTTTAPLNPFAPENMIEAITVGESSRKLKCLAHSNHIMGVALSHRK